MRKNQLFYNIVCLPVDFLMLLLAGSFTYVFRTEILKFFRPVLFEFNLPFREYILSVVFVSFSALFINAILGLYSFRETRSFLEEFSKIIITCSASILVVIIYIFLRQELYNSRFLVLGTWFFAMVFLTLGRFLVRQLEKLIFRSEVRIHKILMIGNDDTTERMKKELELKSTGYKIVEHLADLEIDRIRLIIKDPGIDEVILANPNYSEERVLELIDFCNENHIDFKFVPNIYQTLTQNVSLETFGGIPLVELRRTSLGGWGRVIKRMVDVFGSGFGVLILSPVFLLIAFGIKWESEGPVFVKLKRVSRNKEFYLYKFRSMIKNAEALKPLLVDSNERKNSPLFKMKNDPRVTRFGKFLRKYRLDELPQLFNVFKGDMSLVGPRPHQPDEISKYKKHHKKVLAIKAGITGLAQISGASDLNFEDEVAFDSFYIEKWSMFMDFKILLKTFFKAFRDRSAV